MDTKTPRAKASLRRQMLLYIAFQSVVFLTLAAEISFFIHGESVMGALERVAAEFDVPHQLLIAPVSALQTKIAVMLAVLLATVGLVMTLFIKRITLPLAATIRSAVQIAEGDLSTTVPIHFNDEIGLLATAINDMSANYQEVLLLAQSLSRQAHSELTTEPDSERLSPDAVQAIRGRLKELDGLLTDFTTSFYRAESSR